MADAFGFVPPDMADPAIAEYVRKEQEKAALAPSWARKAMLAGGAALAPIAPFAPGLGLLGDQLLRGQQMDQWAPGERRSSAIAPLTVSDSGHYWLDPEAGFTGSALRGVKYVGDVMKGNTAFPVPEVLVGPSGDAERARIAALSPEARTEDRTKSLSQLADMLGLLIGGGGAGAEEGAVGAVGGALRHGVSKVKLPKPIEEMTSVINPTTGAEKVISPADLQGSRIVPLIGDRTASGGDLLQVNGYKFDQPVPLQGGPTYMRDTDAAWASNRAPAVSLQNKVTAAGADGTPVYGAHLAMGERSGDFSHMTAGAVAQMVPQAKVPRAAAQIFDQEMRGRGVADWPGVKSDKLADWLNEPGRGEVRKLFVQQMDTARYQKMGFPSVAEARVATTDPRLLNEPLGASGLTVARMEPGAALVDPKHITYDSGIPGQYAGGPPVGTPRYQVADQQWVDNVSKHLEGRGFTLGSGSTDEAGQIRSQAALAVARMLADEGPTAAAQGAAPVAGSAGRGLGGGARSLAEAQAEAARVAAGAEPLAGLPQKPLIIDGDHYVPGPNGAIRKVAEDYMAKAGRPYEPPTQYHPLDKEHSSAIAKAFDEMKHAPNDPAVKASYDAMIDETLAQFDAIKKTGLKIEFIKPGMDDPYFANPRLAARDVADNNHLWVFPTSSGHGTVNKISENPLLRPTDIEIDGHKLVANDVFRIVHDYFGHLKEGHGFRAAGEDNAWRAHSAMYSDLARPAMTAETRGQNSWVNYGPHGEKNRTANAADTVYADQKVGIMPEWTMRDRGSPDPLIAYHGSPHKHAKFDSKYLGTGEGEEVYGRGHYLGQAEKTAIHYRDILTKDKETMLLHGRPVDTVWNDQIRENWADTIKALPKTQREDFVNILSELGQVTKMAQLQHVLPNFTPAQRKLFDQKIMPHLIDAEPNPGHLYQVALDVNPDHLLNWDRLFKDQTGHVRDALMPDMLSSAQRKLAASEKILARPDRPTNNPLARARQERDRLNMLETLRKSPEQIADETPGGIVYRAMGLPAKDQREAYGKATKAMLERGVPGIKYLDQASRPTITKTADGYIAEVGDKVLGPFARQSTAIRNAEKRGTSNYVIFDDKLIRILKRYGILLPGAGVAAEMGAGGFGSLAPQEQ